jgi:hypothetical protein
MCVPVPFATSFHACASRCFRISLLLPEGFAAAPQAWLNILSSHRDLPPSVCHVSPLWSMNTLSHCCAPPSPIFPDYTPPPPPADAPESRESRYKVALQRYKPDPADAVEATATAEQVRSRLEPHIWLLSCILLHGQCGPGASLSA